MIRAQARAVTVRELIRTAHVIPQLRVKRKGVPLVVCEAVSESVQDSAKEAVQFNPALERMIELVVGVVIGAVAPVCVCADEKCERSRNLEAQVWHKVFRERVGAAERKRTVVFILVCRRDPVGTILSRRRIMVGS